MNKNKKYNTYDEMIEDIQKQAKAGDKEACDFLVELYAKTLKKTFMPKPEQKKSFMFR